MRLIPTVLAGVLAGLLVSGCATGKSHTPGPRPGSDGGPDMDGGSGGLDARVDGLPAPDSGLDAGGRDASAGDTGARDAGMRDGDRCAPLTMCGAACVDTSVSLSHCGGCDMVCAPAHAMGRCVSGRCEVVSCDPGFLDCDDRADTGCEELDDCAEGAACMTGCGTTGAISCSDRCAPSCTAPAESCNAADDDCDGRCDEGLSGCRRGVHRSYNGGSGEHFYTTSRMEAECCGFRVEFYDFYYLYASATPGLVAFYRCLLASGFHFYTTSSTCEGAPGSRAEGIMGYLSGSPRCGSVPLYRLVNGNDHFYTVSAMERDYAVSIGYRAEGVAGHVWTDPGG